VGLVLELTPEFLEAVQVNNIGTGGEGTVLYGVVSIMGRVNQPLYLLRRRTFSSVSPMPTKTALQIAYCALTLT